MTAQDLAARLLADTAATVHTDLRAELIEAAVRYAGLRARWALFDRAERFNIEAERTSAHDVFIDACNIMSRAMQRSGEDNAWRAALGTERRAIGDVACHIHCLIALSAA